MNKTLLLCFIHGFKGDDTTFGNFPWHLRALISQALPRIDIQVMIYPKFETRGDLMECVAKFRDWLQDRVIDIEVSHHTPSPTIDPSVRVILIGHSMGGIVGAEAVLAIASEQTIPHLSSGSLSQRSSPRRSPRRSPSSSSRSQSHSHSHSHSHAHSHSHSHSHGHSHASNSRASSVPSSPSDCPFMFPYVQGLLAFDTPYLGISPGVIAHGAEDNYRTVSSVYSAYTQAAALFGWGTQSTSQDSKPLAALPAASASTSSAAATTTTTSNGWNSYARFALIASGAGALFAGVGAALYSQRTHLATGWDFVTSHLEFVGCLARGEELRARLQGVVALSRDHGLGFRCIYTMLPQRGNENVDTSTKTKNDGFVDQFVGRRRTFINVPSENSENNKYFSAHVNPGVRDEPRAHMSMFNPAQNPHYRALAERAAYEIVTWVRGSWWIDS